MNLLLLLFGPVLNKLTSIEREIMALQDDVNALTDQVRKGTAEVLSKIEEIEAANPDVDLTALKEAAQALDDVVPDEAPEEPTE